MEICLLLLNALTFSIRWLYLFTHNQVCSWCSTFLHQGISSCWTEGLSQDHHCVLDVYICACTCIYCISIYVCKCACMDMCICWQMYMYVSVCVYIYNFSCWCFYLLFLIIYFCSFSDTYWLHVWHIVHTYVGIVC